MGEPHRLIRGFDYRGQLCGFGDLKDFDYTFVLDPEVSPAATCLDGCPIVATSNSVCLFDALHEFEILSIPCYNSYTAKGFYNHYCFPSVPSARSALEPYLESSSFTLTRLLGDISRGWDLMAVGIMASLAVAALALSCLQCQCSRTLLTYSSVIGCLSLLMALAFFIYEESVRVEEHYCDDFGPVVMPHCSSPEYYRGISYAFMAIVCLFSLMVAYQAPKLTRGKLALRLGVLPISDILRLSVLPLAGFLMCFGVLALMFSGIVYLASCATIEETDDSVLPGERRRELVFGEWERVACLLLLFVGLWWTSLIAFWVEFVGASVSQSWFFEKDRKIVRGAFRKAIQHAFLHTGSLAYASVILPLLLLPRNFLNAMKTITKRLSCNRAHCYLKACHCCLSFYESTLKFKVEQTIAHQALWGDSFEAAGRKSFFLVKRSESQPQQLLAACHFVIWMCEMCVLLAAPGFAYYCVLHRSATFDGARTKFITSGAWVCFSCSLFSWSLAAVFRGYIRGSVHGVTLAYLCEQEMFPGLQRSENREIAHIIEDQAAMNLAEVVAEESLKPTGFDIKGKNGLRKTHVLSRADILRETQVTNHTKTLDSEVENVDDLNQTGLEYHQGDDEDEDDQVGGKDWKGDLGKIGRIRKTGKAGKREARTRPWTPELKFKQKIHKPSPANPPADHQRADESLPIDDSRPFAGPPPRSPDSDPDEEVPDFRPYRFIDLIKQPVTKPKPASILGNVARIVPQATVQSVKSQAAKRTKAKVGKPDKRMRVL